MLAIALISAVAGLMMFALQWVVADVNTLHILGFRAVFVLRLIGAFFIFISVSAWIFSYLRGDFSRMEISSASLGNVGVTKKNGDLTDLIDNVRVSDEYETSEPPPSPEDAVGKRFRRTRTRLREEIQTVTRRATLNLVIGVMVTMVATGVLVYLVSRDHGEFAKLTNLLSFYIPRITTVVLIETFAYFFLKFYRQNLEEIKYYQNELTTLDAQEIAWKASVIADNGDSKKVVIEQLAKNDRNSRRTEEYEFC